MVPRALGLLASAGSMSPLEPKHPAIGRTIRSLRLETGMTQEELALEMSIDAGEISRLETGKRNPTWESMKRLAKGLGIPCREMAAAAEKVEAEMGEENRDRV